MGLTAMTVDEMIRGFPNRVLPIVTAEPTFEDIMHTQKLWNANCISIPSLVGGGHHGCLGLLMTMQEYTTISSTHFDVAFDPGSVSQLAIGTEAVEAASLSRVGVTKSAKSGSSLNSWSCIPLPSLDLIASSYSLLNYSHSRNPPCAPARTHGRTQAPREPPN
jgi:hypothetical protein